MFAITKVQLREVMVPFNAQALAPPARLTLPVLKLAPERPVRKALTALRESAARIAGIKASEPEPEPEPEPTPEPRVHERPLLGFD